MKFVPYLIIVNFFLGSVVLAQTIHRSRNEEIQKQIDEMYRQRDELFKSLLDDSSFDNLDKRFEDLIKKFEQDSFGAFEGFGQEQIFGEYDWRENNEERIFSLKVKQLKDKPLDIKISNKQIRIKGEIESKIVSPDKKSSKSSRSHFERSFDIPDDVIVNEPIFENKNGEILIKFKKLKKKSPVFKNNPPSSKERLPIEKGQNDLTI